MLGFCVEKGFHHGVFFFFFEFSVTLLCFSKKQYFVGSTCFDLMTFLPSSSFCEIRVLNYYIVD